ncbi:MAG: hypothetical protein K2L96_03345 [Muribaculaceae bacterium]|nr:hypothetical protein [Muribaculaceae bacterium]
MITTNLRNIGLGFVLSTCVISVTSCIDDNYDLSDIDTTTEVKVNDLTIPVNFKDIYLEKIIDLDESNPDAIIKIREIDGIRYYYFSKDGNFDANPKSIEKVKASAPDHIESSTIHISAVTATPDRIARKATSMAGQDYLEYQVTPYSTEFTYKVGEDGNPTVDSAIKSIASVGFDKDNPMTLTMSIKSQDIAESASRIELYNVVIQAPQGSKAHYGDIVSENDLITIPYLSSTTGSLDIEIVLTNLDFVTADSPEGKVVTDGKFRFQEEVGVKGGIFRVYPGNGYSVADLPAEIDFRTDYEMSDFSVDMFSGVFDYAIDFDEVDPFRLTDIPEFLRGNGTDIHLAEPSLTLNVNTPVATYGLECVAGLTLTAERSDYPSTVEVLNSFVLGNQTEQQFHLLAPSDKAWGIDLPSNYYFTSFPGLRDILSGAGLPEIVRVDFKSPTENRPRVYGKAVDFPLGRTLDQVHGDYTFSAPLALADGSEVFYTKTIDGWNDEDVDAIAISSIKVKAMITSNIPAGARVTIRPIDKEGKRIPLTNEATAYATLDAVTTPQEISLELIGDIRHLDGLYIEAVVDDFNGEALSPDFTLKVSDLKATVTGSYTKEL